MCNKDEPDVRSAVGPLDAKSTTNGGRGWFGTVQVGCDYQFAQNWVVGVFGDYDFADLKGHMSYPDNSLDWRENKLKDSWAVGGRVGWLVTTATPDLRFSGGYTEARFEQRSTFTTIPSAPQPILHVNRQTYGGWFIGSGVRVWARTCFCLGCSGRLNIVSPSYDSERNANYRHRRQARSTGSTRSTREVGPDRAERAGVALELGRETVVITHDPT